MIVIIIIELILYAIAIAISWQNLGTIEKPKKVAYIAIGLLVIYIITSILFGITKGEIIYENAQMQKDIQNIIVTMFTGINGIILIPQIGRILDQINEKNIEEDKLKKKIIIIAIIFIICIIIETGYMKDIQQGIIKIYNAKKG